MLRKLSLRLPIDIYEELRQEALRARVSISDVIREKIFQLEVAPVALNPSFSKGMDLQRQLSDILSALDQKDKFSEETYRITFELRLLLREFLLERNGQILRKVDQELKKWIVAEGSKNQ